MKSIVRRPVAQTGNSRVSKLVRRRVEARLVYDVGLRKPYTAVYQTSMYLGSRAAERLPTRRMMARCEEQQLRTQGQAAGDPGKTAKSLLPSAADAGDERSASEMISSPRAPSPISAESLICLHTDW